MWGMDAGGWMGGRDSRVIACEPYSGEMAPSQLAHDDISTIAELVANVNRMVPSRPVIFQILLVFSEHGRVVGRSERGGGCGWLWRVWGNIDGSLYLSARRPLRCVPRRVTARRMHGSTDDGVRASVSRGWTGVMKDAVGAGRDGDTPPHATASKPGCSVPFSLITSHGSRGWMTVAVVLTGSDVDAIVMAVGRRGSGCGECRSEMGYERWMDGWMG